MGKVGGAPHRHGGGMGKVGGATGRGTQHTAPLPPQQGEGPTCPAG